MSASASSNSYKNHHYYSPSRGVRYAPPPPPPHHLHHHHPHHHAYYPPPPHHAHHAHPHYSMPPAPPPHAAAMTEHLQAKASRREGEQVKATSHYRAHPNAYSQPHHAHYHRYPHHAYSHPHEYAAWASHAPAAAPVPAPVAPPMAARTAAPQMTAPATQPPAVVSQAPGSRVLQQLPLPEPIKKVSKESTKNTLGKQGVFQKSLKSPVTMCFERMLGAADYLATSSVPTPKPAANQNSALGPMQAQENARPVTVVGNQKQAKENSQVSVRLVEKFSNKQSTPVNFTEKTVSIENATVVSEEKSSNKRTAQEMETTAGSSPSNNPFDEIANDKELHRQVILHMALQRNIGDEAVPRDSVCTNAPLNAIGVTGINQEAKKVIEDGFYWKDFPVCEAVLYKHMAEYYGVSCAQRQSRMQQYFNKKLVNAVREAALSEGLTFDPSFTEKKLRDRIRCFYKTHLQNAKKRLVTLQKRSNSQNNQAIVRVYVNCVKEGVSYEDSLGMIESAKTAPTDNDSNKKSRTEQFATVPVHEI